MGCGINMGSDQDYYVKTVFSNKVHYYPDLLNNMNRKNDLDDDCYSQQNLNDD